MANGDRLFVPASGSTGVEAWALNVRSVGMN
jgi:hypothetical protein